jgi:transposase
VRACYEAGPLGYTLQRELEAHGVICEVVAPWVRHMNWLRPLTFDYAAAQASFDHSLLTIDPLDERLRQLAGDLEAFGGQEPYRQPAAWLRCFRGIDTVTAVSLVAELHDFHRFRTARALMAYLGLVPSERSSGEQRRQGKLPRAGNAHVRRLLVEAAWHHRHRPTLSQPLRRRREGQPPHISRSPIALRSDCTDASCA